ncbi:MAG: TIGR01777 family oxidoreductase [Sphingobacteriales bacterium]|nr:TIGR01777 family oxidoreductase [Sphingobacteriales bacterium]OJW33367.1 MAG: TIGR01777 family protein [Sphingobacteriales bacterium 46-32]
MAKIIITGGTGLIGQALTKSLTARGDEVVILTRHPEKYKAQSGITYAGWDPARHWIDPEVWPGATAVINLAGAGVADKRWSNARKQEIRDSRVQGGEAIVKALSNQKHQVQTVISASAIGWYGPDPQIPNPAPFREDAPAADDFLGQTCLAWEQSLHPLEALNIRLVKLRTGIVLSRSGGALKEFSRPLRWGIAAIMGSGRQHISWIHIDDLVRIYLFALDHPDCRGNFNAVAPTPVSNQQFIEQLGKQLRGRFFIPVYIPAFLLRWILGEMSVEVLKSTTVSCSRLHVEGFQFLYPELQSALQQLHDKPSA